MSLYEIEFWNIIDFVNKFIRIVYSVLVYSADNMQKKLQRIFQKTSDHWTLKQLVGEGYFLCQFKRNHKPCRVSSSINNIFLFKLGSDIAQKTQKIEHYKNLDLNNNKKNSLVTHFWFWQVFYDFSVLFPSKLVLESMKRKKKTISLTVGHIKKL